MNVKIDNFIGVFENAIEDNWCNEVIQWYNTVESHHSERVLNRQDSENANPKFKKNDFVFLNENLDKGNAKSLNKHLDNILSNQVIPYYHQKYPFIGWELEEYYLQGFKIQKTKPEEGYHIWHYETDCDNCETRFLTYMVYLNDIEEGGETEFLYQRTRIKPQKGTIVLFPPHYTHVHRGNPPLKGIKYAVTGWVHYPKAF